MRAVRSQPANTREMRGRERKGERERRKKREKERDRDREERVGPTALPRGS